MERSELEALVHTYVDAVGRQDIDALVAMFAEDAIQEDPVGTPPNVGHDAIRGFFEKSFAVPFSVEMNPEILVGGNYASFRFVITVPIGDDKVVVRVADLLKANDDGTIAQLWAIQDMG